MTTMNMVPEFSNDGTEEVKQAVDTTVETETPAELPADEGESLEQPAEPVIPGIPGTPVIRDDSSDLTKQIQGLQDERVKLLKEIQDLRGQRRELKRDELSRVEERIDDLQDVSPEDVKVIDKVIRSKGYLTREESQKMFYESVKQEEVDKFLEKFPEYKPENDPNDINWNALQREFSIFRAPDNPRLIGDRLERAHKSVARVTPDRNVEAKRQQIRTASVGSGGVQRSSSHKSLDPDKRAMLDRGGWSQEEIKRIEERLN